MVALTTVIDPHFRFIIFNMSVVCALVGVHLLLSIRLWRSTHLVRSLLHLVVLSFSTALVWQLVAFTIFLGIALSPHSSPPAPALMEVFSNTFGLPFNHNLVGWLPAIPSLPIYEIYSFLILVAFLYLLGFVAHFAVRVLGREKSIG
jgi:hypothetical protein